MVVFVVLPKIMLKHHEVTCVITSITEDDYSNKNVQYKCWIGMKIKSQCIEFLCKANIYGYTLF